MASTSGDGHQGEGGGGDEQHGGGGEDEEGSVIVHRPLLGLLPYEEEEDDEEDLDDVVEVGAEDDVEGQQGCWGADIGEAAHVAQEGGAGEEVVRFLNWLESRYRQLIAMSYITLAWQDQINCIYMILVLEPDACVYDAYDAVVHYYHNHHK